MQVCAMKASNQQQLGPTHSLVGSLAQWSMQPHEPGGAPELASAMSGDAVMPQLVPQVPLQQVWPVGQTTPPHLQVPWSQVAPSPHLLPHAPQLRMSESRLAQPRLPQQVWPMPQAAPDGGQPQWPPLHTVPDGQALPQSPQLSGSALTSRHWSPQHLPAHCSGCDGQMLWPAPASPPLPAGLPTAQPAAASASPRTRPTSMSATRDAIGATLTPRAVAVNAARGPFVGGAARAYDRAMLPAAAEGAASAATPAWHAAARVGFRFVVAWTALVCLPFPLDLLPRADAVLGVAHRPWAALVVGFGHHVLGVARPLAATPGDSGYG